MRKLVIVESPAKANTINSYLGDEFKVIASKGHVRDLPKSSLGVDIENNFKAKYINIQGKGELINQLKKEAKAADAVYLATDPDREGEAISWHLATVLGIEPEKANRVAFNEITKNTIRTEIEHPRAIDMNLVNSQQARRILDRIVGYKLSPYLWKTVKSGLSAGRVQSVATRIIVEREAEIEAFVPKEFWTIDAVLKDSKHHKVKAKFFGTEEGKKELSSEEEANDVLSVCENGKFIVTKVVRATKSKSPMPPFITSTMQQEASRRLGFQAKKTMRIAQELYEGVKLGAEFGGSHGIITYMRTDSLRISDEAAFAAQKFIVSKYGPEFYPSRRRIFKTKGSAQDAHEAIRPSSMELEPERIRQYLSNDQFKLYKLIWDRFIASQMKNAELDTMNADISCGKYIFKASEYSVKFKGYLGVYEDTDENTDSEKLAKVCELSEGQELTKDSVNAEKNFTSPPPHFNEASLIKFLEEKGIGRPSTYAPTITTIIERGYVERDKKVLRSTPLGVATVELMKKNFPNIVDYKFTANMETNLDKIASGDDTLEDVLGDFYGGFSKTLEKAQSKIKENKVELPVEESDIICEKCGRRMVIKTGRFGKFAACPGYPECKNTKPLQKDGSIAEKKPGEEPEKTDLKCPECGGDIVIRKSRYGKFYACTNFPKCKYTKAIREEIGVACPKCGGNIVRGFGKRKSVFYNCENYPKCDFSVWDMPTNKKCPECGGMLFEKKGKKYLYCAKEGCGYKEDVAEKSEK
ncbi:MAG: type I DNA topoisomerase [Eubacteriales bacterium]